MPVLEEHCQWAFRYLAERQEDGDIFITTTRRLLDYQRVRDHPSFDVSADKASMHITLKSVDCPVYGAEPAIADDVQGITLAIEDAPAKVTMCGATGKTIPLTRFSNHPQTIVSVPWRRLAYPH